MTCGVEVEVRHRGNAWETVPELKHASIRGAIDAARSVSMSSGHAPKSGGNDGDS